ncbi:MAG: dUTP diphosphatase [Candidatus Krumholzibacteriota bacterium]|nr:dUTP diphosphatase [Candidatus Krumholzibacteriota bacterium]
MTPDPLKVKVSIRYLPGHDGLPAVRRMTGGSSGYDICAACTEEIVIPPGEAAVIPSGFELSIPKGFEAQIRPRSGLALKKRIGLLNSPGTIDSDYRGEVGVILYNFGDEDFTVRRGDRIAQMVFSVLPEVEMEGVDSLDETGRGEGGFGHTGQGG